MKKKLFDWLRRVIGPEDAAQPTVSTTVTKLNQRLFEIDPALLEGEEANKAIVKGLLIAKKEALKTASRLALLGWPLLLLVLAVSFAHLSEQVSRIVPDARMALSYDREVYQWVARANTFVIDAAALYLVAVSSIAHYVGKRSGRARFYFYALTALLNSAFVFRNTPAVNLVAAPFMLYVDFAIALLLGLMVPVAIASIERGQRSAEEIRLALLTETTQYEVLVGVGEKAKTLGKILDFVKPTEKAPDYGVCEECGVNLTIGEKAIASRKNVLAKNNGRLLCGQCRAA